ncbi:hypothetical protein AB0B56_02020 [Streptosporangium canum]|uniref:protein kinase domain-containing protein n=1 Tax=Streptosporangium canum TaxID=324952 RepID=UPI003429D792
MTALVAIHQAGIVHRDFNPGSVLLGPDGPRVIDFGIAEALDAGAAGTTRSVGMPAYLTPEQLEGEPVGPAADLFAWGATMLFAASGRSPFEAGSMSGTINRVLGSDPDLTVLDDDLRGHRGVTDPSSGGHEGGEGSGARLTLHENPADPVRLVSYFITDNKGPVYSTYAREPGGAAFRLIAQNADFGDPTVSPDGKWVAVNPWLKFAASSYDYVTFINRATGEKFSVDTLKQPLRGLSGTWSPDSTVTCAISWGSACPRTPDSAPPRKTRSFASWAHASGAWAAICSRRVRPSPPEASEAPEAPEALEPPRSPRSPGALGTPRAPGVSGVPEAPPRPVRRPSGGIAGERSSPGWPWRWRCSPAGRCTPWSAALSSTTRRFPRPPLRPSSGRSRTRPPPRPERSASPS